MRRYLKKILVLCVSLGLFAFGLMIYTARLAAYPWWYESKLVGKQFKVCSSHQKEVNFYCDNPEINLKLKFKEFEAPVVKGWIVSTENEKKNGTVILVHGAGNDRRSMLKHTPYLVAAGYDVLLIDCYNHGMNYGDGKGISFGFKESDSILSTIHWIRENKLSENIFVMGTSQGAFTALFAAARTTAIDGIIAENPFQSAKRILLEYPALKYVPQFLKKGSLNLLEFWMGISLDQLDTDAFITESYHTPVFLIHGDQDETISFEHSNNIYTKLKTVQGEATRSKLWIVSKAKHETEWNREKQNYENQILEFFSDTIKLKQP